MNHSQSPGLLGICSERRSQSKNSLTAWTPAVRIDRETMAFPFPKLRLPLTRPRVHLYRQLNPKLARLENPRRITSSDSESDASSSRGSRLFSEELASTKLSSLEEETNHTSDTDVRKQKIKDFYRHTETTDNRPGDTGDIRSLASEPEDIQSQDGSATDHWAVTTAAVSYLAEVLAEDPDLTPLYLDAAQRLEDYRFLGNHRRLLKKYYLYLRSQTTNQKQRAVIEFLRPRSHRHLISRRVLEQLQSHDKTKRERAHAALPQDEERDLTLERYLNNVETTSKGLPADAMETAPDSDDESSMDEEEDHHSISALVDLEETRSFFVSGVPLARFKAEFQNFLDPGRERVEETSLVEVAKSLERPKVLRWGARLSAWIFDLCSPPKPGNQRVRYICVQLVPVGEAIVPNHFKCGEFPPCSEVKVGNYLYEPVPMADVALASIPLWHLTRPGRHSDKYWIMTFPKKLRYPLRREAGVYGKPVIGWGIRVNECFNWGQFLFPILAVIVLIGAIMGAYLALKADDSSGFGLAAFLAAVAAIYIPYQYFAWKEKLE
ncbi:uncharacterized protein GLRG_09580 [Colletotrichum graminicola M1.001]|uniref:Uncharacterized protein n=1 Tax=Colletotrichum graminicola (strain M1.001 / M2 / FGSC 10212) TaxID=645133 RepID=E3QU98_COLGM|nr:uncharacterized protein GLRG_09580 [Colletotrichum graminicola M1.001]EFQ34436.1 hypothetical protein GLRG_09580 [Colletotrichum graminicola M1.001]